MRSALVFEFDLGAREGATGRGVKGENLVGLAEQGQGVVDGRFLSRRARLLFETDGVFGGDFDLDESLPLFQGDFDFGMAWVWAPCARAAVLNKPIARIGPRFWVSFIFTSSLGRGGAWGGFLRVLTLNSLLRLEETSQSVLASAQALRCGRNWPWLGAID